MGKSYYAVTKGTAIIDGNVPEYDKIIECGGLVCQDNGRIFVISYGVEHYNQASRESDMITGISPNGNNSHFVKISDEQAKLMIHAIDDMKKTSEDMNAAERRFDPVSSSLKLSELHKKIENYSQYVDSLVDNNDGPVNSITVQSQPKYYGDNINKFMGDPSITPYGRSATYNFS